MQLRMLGEQQLVNKPLEGVSNVGGGESRVYVLLIKSWDVHN